MGKYVTEIKEQICCYEGKRTSKINLLKLTMDKRFYICITQTVRMILWCINREVCVVIVFYVSWTENFKIPHALFIESIHLRI